MDRPVPTLSSSTPRVPESRNTCVCVRAKGGVSPPRPASPCVPSLFSFQIGKTGRVLDCCLCAFTTSVNYTKETSRSTHTKRKARRCSSFPPAVAVTHCWGMRLRHCGRDKVPLGRIKASAPGQRHWLCVCSGWTSSGGKRTDFLLSFSTSCLKLNQLGSTIAVKSATPKQQSLDLRVIGLVVLHTIHRCTVKPLKSGCIISFHWL